MIVGVVKFISLVEQSRVEDKVNILLNKTLNMPVRKFGWVTFRLTWNGFDTHFVYLSI